MHFSRFFLISLSSDVFFARFFPPASGLHLTKDRFVRYNKTTGKRLFIAARPNKRRDGRAECER
ncbi:MAG TPA: hypothetical protein DCE65_02840 [Clostridiales bacterium]|nr:hypothetical protein [Clostridiales bacterium]